MLEVDGHEPQPLHMSLSLAGILQHRRTHCVDPLIQSGAILRQAG